MKTLIVILIIASFLQSTIIPINLGLMILICRAYIVSDKANLYLAFVFGLFISHLNLSRLGIESLIFLVIVSATGLLSRLRLADNPLLIIPVTFVFLFADQLVGSYLAYQVFDFSKIIIASFLSLPALYLIRAWEERFIVQKDIKLKI